MHQNISSSSHHQQPVLLVSQNSQGNNTNTSEIPDYGYLKDLISVLVESSVLILIGYTAARRKFVSRELRDLDKYLATLALPVVIFLSIAQIELNSINWSFLAIVLSCKLTIFIVVAIICCSIQRKSYAGALSILATQSNDFALGYPLIESIFARSSENQHEMLNYLSLMVMLQLLIINPLGVILLELFKKRRLPHIANSDANVSTQSQISDCGTNTICHIENGIVSPLYHGYMHQNNYNSSTLSTHSSNESTTNSSSNIINSTTFAAPITSALSKSRFFPILCFFADLFSNPLILATICGATSNILYGPTLPKYLTRGLSKIAASFAAPALFTIGASMVGKFTLLLKSPRNLVLASSIVATKNLILPFMLRTATLLILSNSNSNSNNIMTSSDTVDMNFVQDMANNSLPFLQENADSISGAHNTPIDTLVDFSLLYGLLPIAPGACIIANQFEVMPNVVSISMLLSVLLATPLLTVAALVIGEKA